MMNWVLYITLFAILFVFYGNLFGSPTSFGDVWFLFIPLALTVLFGIVAIIAVANQGGIKAIHAKDENEKLEKEKRELERVRKLVEEHIDTLSRKRRALIRKGDYGEVIDEAWRKEINRFAKIVLPDLLYMSLGGSNEGAGYRLESFIDRLVSEHMKSRGQLAADADISTMNGVEYEAFCGEILEAGDWKVQRTPPTGDHGVDLIAEKPGRRVAIQCKKYSTPVGNKAVQEAYSGMKFFDAEEAVVVTNSTFTQAAQVLANKLSVALKHHDELRGL